MGPFLNWKHQKESYVEQQGVQPQAYAGGCTGAQGGLTTGNEACSHRDRSPLKWELGLMYSAKWWAAMA